jgi:hypothetical protein
MENLVSGKDGSSRAVLEGLGKDAVTVVLVEYEEIVVAVARWGDKPASLVSVYLSSGLHKSGITMMGANVGCIAVGKVVDRIERGGVGIAGGWERRAR